ncbi:hypothetical protein K432DRAFT_377414 [Lepidopterella palustris CBS 459.81]|uniref:Uncharacterized protein n=1 Tax=Lepidopterella palustris CBS 459.81 TaxID=1314670 RepID=A0A8E2EKH2_9PEZI|nr:hypothetical protein K432DRAFT_377414 [Lepidopterella palustris CBS 459.81]
MGPRHEYSKATSLDHKSRHSLIASNSPTTIFYMPYIAHFLVVGPHGLIPVQTITSSSPPTSVQSS